MGHSPRVVSHFSLTFTLSFPDAWLICSLQSHLDPREAWVPSLVEHHFFLFLKLQYSTHNIKIYYFNNF